MRLPQSSTMLDPVLVARLQSQWRNEQKVTWRRDDPKGLWQLWDNLRVSNMEADISERDLDLCLNGLPRGFVCHYHANGEWETLCHWYWRSWMMPLRQHIDYDYSQWIQSFNIKWCAFQAVCTLMQSTHLPVSLRTKNSNKLWGVNTRDLIQ